MGGLGTTQNFNQACCAKLAADQANSCGYVLLGELYYEGKGVEKSLEEAMHFFRLADVQEHPAAWDFLAEAYKKGIGLEKSEEKANFYPFELNRAAYSHDQKIRSHPVNDQVKT
jgi:hypothetical protein